jgi:hypothetical protein
MPFYDKIESLGKPFQGILRVRTVPTPVKPLSGDPLGGRLMALPTSIRLGWKGLPGTNTLAYCNLI